MAVRLSSIAGTLLTLVVVAAAVVASGPVSAGARTGAAVGAASAYAFDDEFDGAAVDTAAWHVLHRGGDASNHEAQCYLPGNVSEAGGNLAITSKVDASCPGYRYTSGMVQWATFAFTFGTIEIRARQSGGQGSWPAQWLLGAKCQVANVTTHENTGGCNWPTPGSDEIDIAEFKVGRPGTVLQNVISGHSGFRTCTEAVPAADANWHVYALTRTPTAVTWSVDGTVTCTERAVVPTAPMFLIMNNAMGGDGGGRIDPGDFPRTMLIDYVRVKKT